MEINKATNFNLDHICVKIIIVLVHGTSHYKIQYLERKRKKVPTGMIHKMIYERTIIGVTCILLSIVLEQPW